MPWRIGEDSERIWLQYVSDAEDFAILSFIRQKGIQKVHILFQEVPDELKNAPESMCSYSLQDYNGDEYIAVDGVGFLKDNIAGQRVFTTGNGTCPDNLAPFRNVIQHIQAKFVFQIDVHDRIFEINEQERLHLLKMYSDDEPIS